MQDRRDVGQECYRIAEMHDKMMQNTGDSGGEGCKAGSKKDIRDAGQE